MAGEFIFFWSILVPLVMIAGSIFITYVLHRHFSRKMQEQRQEGQTDQN